MGLIQRQRESCGHLTMERGKCPACGYVAGSGFHDFCGKPWDDHSGWLIAKVVSPACPKAEAKK